MLTRGQRKTIVELQDYLSKISHRICQTHWPQADPDDVLQEMSLYVAERAQQDPAFLQQAPGYVTKAAAWHARHWLRHTFTRFHLGQRIAAGIPLETDEDDERPADEIFASPQLDNDIAIDARTALAGLDEISLAVAELKMAGLQRKEIAEELGFSSQALGTYLKRIEAALRPVWESVTDEPETVRQLSFGL